MRREKKVLTFGDVIWKALPSPGSTYLMGGLHVYLDDVIDLINCRNSHGEWGQAIVEKIDQSMLNLGCAENGMTISCPLYQGFARILRKLSNKNIQIMEVDDGLIWLNSDIWMNPTKYEHDEGSRIAWAALCYVEAITDLLENKGRNVDSPVERLSQAKELAPNEAHVDEALQKLETIKSLLASTAQNAPSSSGDDAVSGSNVGKVVGAIIVIGIAAVLLFHIFSNQSSTTVSGRSAGEAIPPKMNSTGPPPNETYSGYPSEGRYLQNTKSVIKEYFENRFQFSVTSADVANDRIVLNFEIQVLTNRDYFFLCNKENVSDSVNSTEKPYILDSNGSKREMMGTLIGNILQNVFPDNERGFNPDRTYRFRLGPNEKVSGSMEFPMVSEGIRVFSLIIPRVNGWQSQIRIDNIQLITDEKRQREGAQGRIEPNQPVVSNQYREIPGFVERYFKDTENRNIDLVLSHYGEQVDYFAKGVVGKDFIRKDKQSYFKRWTTIVNTLDGQPQIQETSQDNIRVVRFASEFSVKNEKQCITGRADNTWTLRSENNQWKIIGEQQQVLSRDKK